MGKESYPSCLGVDHVSHCWLFENKMVGKAHYVYNMVGYVGKHVSKSSTM
jgi:hypothetical protein